MMKDYLRKFSLNKNQDSAYFYYSPIGMLEIKFKEGKLYSLSRMPAVNSALPLYSKSHRKSFSLGDDFLKNRWRVFQKNSFKKRAPFDHDYFLFSKNKLNSFFPREVISLARQLNHYFLGWTIKSWKVLLFSQGTSFQKKVWKTLSCIPYGTTRTYKDVARLTRSPQAMRAVGSACGKNPWLLVVPCHRVVAQNHLGGFGLGLKTKSFLLNLENPHL